MKDTEEPTAVQARTPEVVMRRNLNERGVPTHLRDGLVNYLVHGYLPGSFLTAVLTNNLLDAFRYADVDSRAGLWELVNFLYNDAPIAAWGSVAKVEDWRQARATERQAVQS